MRVNVGADDVDAARLDVAARATPDNDDDVASTCTDDDPQDHDDGAPHGSDAADDRAPGGSDDGASNGTDDYEDAGRCVAHFRGDRIDTTGVPGIDVAANLDLARVDEHDRHHSGDRPHGADDRQLRRRRYRCREPMDLDRAGDPRGNARYLRIHAASRPPPAALPRQQMSRPSKRQRTFEGGRPARTRCSAARAFAVTAIAS